MEEVKLEPIEAEPESDTQHWKELDESLTDNFVDVKPFGVDQDQDQPEPVLFVKQECSDFDVGQQSLEGFKDEKPEYIVGENECFMKSDNGDDCTADDELKVENCETTLKENEVASNPNTEKTFVCYACRYSTNDLAQSRRHAKSHYQRFEHKCSKCAFSTPVEFCLKRHMYVVHVLHSTEKNKTCNLCEYRTNRESSLRNHIESVHLKVKKYQCRFCDHKSYLKRDSQLHMASVHLKLKNHECPFCDYKALQKSTIKYHMRGVHKVEEGSST